MATDSSLNLKDIIDILKRETSLGEEHRHRDWDEIVLDGGERAWIKGDFECRLSWQKVQLYEIEAREFLSFAKQDLKEGSDKGRVNALRNAKSAIGCRIDELLALLNLKGLSSSHFYWDLPNGLPYKMDVLQEFGILAPGVLKRQITSKRNLLEHEYIRPKNQEEVQDIVDIAELFLKATDQYVEKGYISSATITCTTWIDTSLMGGYRDKYEINFDLRSETLTLRHWKEYSDNFATSRDSGSREKARIKSERTFSKFNRQVNTSSLAIKDYKKEDVRELMILLREKGE